MKSIYISISFLLFIFTNQVSAQSIVGWIEQVGVDTESFKMLGKMDSGARHSSIHATDMRIIQKGSEKWVNFTVTNKIGQRIRLEKKIIRTASIKQKGSKSQERPVINLGICVGSVYKEVEVNVVNRGNFNFQLLVGRSFLNPNFLVDSSKKLMSIPTCWS